MVPPPLAANSPASRNFHPLFTPHDSRQIAWLNRSNHWPEFGGYVRGDITGGAGAAAGVVWIPDRVLGGGTLGLLGKWNYTGPSPASPITTLVVKQSAGRAALDSLIWESKLLRQVSGVGELDANRVPRGTDYVVKLYKAFHYGGGTGSHDTLDPLPFPNNAQGVPVWDPDKELGRIFLEFCDGGDLHGAIRRMMDDRTYSNRFTEEEELWRIFDYLVKAVLVLETGSDLLNPANVNRDWRRIAHLDIKDQNVLIELTNLGNTPAHTRLNPLKLADFGHNLAIPRFRTKEAQEAWWEHAKWRGTQAWLAPEQRYPTTEKDYYNDFKQLNIWGIGAIMHKVLTGRVVNKEARWHHWASQVTSRRRPRRNRKTFLGLGIDLLGEPR